jgi:hypothetical protein
MILHGLHQDAVILITVQVSDITALKSCSCESSKCVAGNAALLLFKQVALSVLLQQQD